MPVPLPEAEVLLTPPDYDEVILSARAKVTAVRGPGGRASAAPAGVPCRS